MNPLEPKPPDPCPPAPSFLSWNLPCPFLLTFWPKLPEFTVSFHCLRAIDTRFGSSRLGWAMLFKRSSRFALQLRIWSFRADQQVPKFQKLKLCSVSYTIAIHRQETQVSASRPESSLRAKAARFGHPRFDCDAIHELCPSLAFFWASRLGSLNESATSYVNLANWGLLFMMFSQIALRFSLRLLLVAIPFPGGLRPEVFDSLAIVKICFISIEEVVMCIFQVCGLILLSTFFPSILLGSFFVNSSACFNTGLGLMSLCFGHSHCSVSAACHLQKGLYLHFYLKLDMAASFKGFGSGSFAGFPMTLDLAVSTYLSPIVPLLDLVRRSLIRHVGILLVSFITLSLLGTLYLAYVCILGPSLHIHILRVRSFGLPCHQWLHLATCLCVRLYLSSGCSRWVFISGTCVDITILCVPIMDVVCVRLYLSSGCSSWVIISGTCVDITVPIMAAVWSFCFQFLLVLGFLSLSGLIVLIKLWICYSIVHLVKFRYVASSFSHSRVWVIGFGRLFWLIPIVSRLSVHFPADLFWKGCRDLLVLQVYGIAPFWGEQRRCTVLWCCFRSEVTKTPGRFSINSFSAVSSCRSWLIIICEFCDMVREAHCGFFSPLSFQGLRADCLRARTCCALCCSWFDVIVLILWLFMVYYMSRPGPVFTVFTSLFREGISIVVSIVQCCLQGYGQRWIGSWLSQLYLVCGTTLPFSNFLCVCSGLMASEDHWWLFPSLIFQGLFSDCLRARTCSVLFWMLWQPNCCLYSFVLYSGKTTYSCNERLLWQLTITLYYVRIQRQGMSDEYCSLGPGWLFPCPCCSFTMVHGDYVMFMAGCSLTRCI